MPQPQAARRARAKDGPSESLPQARYLVLRQANPAQNPARRWVFFVCGGEGCPGSNPPVRPIVWNDWYRRPICREQIGTAKLSEKVERREALNECARRAGTWTDKCSCVIGIPAVPGGYVPWYIPPPKSDTSEPKASVALALSPNMAYDAVALPPYSLM